MQFYKYQSLLSHYGHFCRKFRKNIFPTYFLSRQINKKMITDNLITKNADIYEKIIGNLATIEWKNIREKILEKNQEITPVTVDSTIINMCLQNLHVDNAIAYFKFLKENGYPLNTAVIAKYLNLYVIKKNLTDMDKIEIVKTYNALKQKHQYLDVFTAEQCLRSLCLTDEWEKALEIIEMMKITCNPCTKIYSAVAATAFRNGKPDVAWKILSDMMLYQLIPQNNVYTSHLKYCQLEDTKTFNSRMEEMFNFWFEHSIIPYNIIVSAYADTATKYGWSTKLVEISKERGICKHCGYSLAEITFSEKEFQELAKSVMHKVIIGSDVYCNTNPKELSNFQKFIENTKPYDIVIDGLNLTYAQKILYSGPKLQWLITVVEHFNKYRKKVLVLTRKHQKKLLQFKQIQKQASVFFVDNLSSDDPFMLYATMASGINAKFVSLDLMRHQKYSLQDDHLKKLFKKWQYSHQYFVKMSKTGIRIQEPFSCMPIAQKSDNCWHVPLVSDDVVNTDSYKFPQIWYCLKRKK